MDLLELLICDDNWRPWTMVFSAFAMFLSILNLVGWNIYIIVISIMIVSFCILALGFIEMIRERSIERSEMAHNYRTAQGA